jgi:FlaG/FlaF family flagellin (archaellin)
MQRSKKMKKRDDAVSPVVGVMLMLVVTIIIAAVVSGFASGVINSQKATPSANFDVSLTDKSIELIVRSVSEDISSKDIAIVLSKPGQTRKLMPGALSVPFGFNIVEWSEVTGFHDNEKVGAEGISKTNAAHINNAVQWFGNYTLKAGSRMSASGNAFEDIVGDPMPEGFSKLSYTKAEFYALTATQWQSVFGDSVSNVDQGTENHVLKINNGASITSDTLAGYLHNKGYAVNATAPTTTNTSLWATATDQLWKFGQTIVYSDGYGGVSVSPGDSVTVTIVYNPSGQTLFMKTVTVREA